MIQAKVLRSAHAPTAGMTRALWLGLVLWGLMFSIASALYPWSVANRRLFESVLAVVLAGATTAVGTAYLRGLEGRILGRAVAASLLWTVTCWTLDFVILMVRPPRLSFGEYLEGTGLTYLMILPIVLGLTYQRLRFERVSPRSRA